MKKFTLLGHNISHSLSPLLHSVLADYLSINISYTLTDINLPNLKNTIEMLIKSFDGFNITAPFKQQAAEILKSQLSSINTVTANPLKTYSTDGTGIVNSLKHFGIEINNSSILIIGAGGSSISAIESLKESGAVISIYNRTASNAIRLSEKYGLTYIDNLKDKRYDVVCSMVPNLDISLLNNTKAKVFLNSDYQKNLQLSDIIYIDGKYMLYYQGVQAFEIFNNVQLDNTIKADLLKLFLKKVDKLWKY